jgi:hypothetical protein
MVPAPAGIGAFTPATATSQGGTLLMTNVVSFHVQTIQSFAPSSATAPRTYAFTYLNPPNGNPYYFFDTAFDSSSTTLQQPPNPLQANVLQPTFISTIAVSLRIWDQKTQQTRQVTVVQDM